MTLTLSAGNEAANGLEDFAAFALAADHTSVVALVAEHIRDPARFLALASDARRRGKVLVMLHSGRSARAPEAAATHTGAMAGDYAVMRTLSEHAGVQVVETLEELLDPAALPAALPGASVWRARRAGRIRRVAGAHLRLLRRDRLAPAAAHEDAQAQLDAFVPGLITAGNPLDLTAQALRDPALYGRAAAR